MVNALKAPRGSPFIDANNRLTPAWHNYIANIEQLDALALRAESVSGGPVLSSADLQRLLEISELITRLEGVITAFEASLANRNWAFYYTNEAVVTDPGVNARGFIAHGLNTRRVMARMEATGFFPNEGDPFCSVAPFSSGLDENNIQMVLSGATYSGNGLGEAWVLGIYD